MEERFMKNIENERKINKDVSANTLKNEQLHNALDLKSKEVEYHIPNSRLLKDHIKNILKQNMEQN